MTVFDFSNPHGHSDITSLGQRPEVLWVRLKGVSLALYRGDLGGWHDHRLNVEVGSGSCAHGWRRWSASCRTECEGQAGSGDILTDDETMCIRLREIVGLSSPSFASDVKQMASEQQP